MRTVNDDDVTTTQGVAIVYAVIRAFNEAFHKVRMPEFADAPEEEQAGASQAFVWVRDHPEATAEQMHTNWREEMVAEGWSFGEFNVEDQTHPHVCEWRDMPTWAKRMLYLVITSVNVLVADEEQLLKAMKK